ncbi:MAG: mechanosensitive ion channel family protein, partial [bacterium]
PNNAIIVPNTKLASSIATNYFQPDKDLSVVLPMGVSYNADLERVERITIEVAMEVMREVPGGVPHFTPFIRYHTFGDSAVEFSVILRAKEFVDQYLIKHEFIKRVHKRYREEGIEIPFPQRVVHLPSSASILRPSEGQGDREK